MKQKPKDLEKIFRDWNCELCQSDVEEIAFAYKSQEAVEYIVQAYQGTITHAFHGHVYFLIRFFSNF